MIAVDNFLYPLRSLRAAFSKTVLVVDESSLASSEQMRTAVMDDILRLRDLELKEAVRADGGAPELRLKSANSDYTCLAEDVHIVGKVLWTVRRV